MHHLSTTALQQHCTQQQCSHNNTTYSSVTKYPITPIHNAPGFCSFFLRSWKINSDLFKNFMLLVNDTCLYFLLLGGCRHFGCCSFCCCGCSCGCGCGRSCGCGCCHCSCTCCRY